MVDVWAGSSTSNPPDGVDISLRYASSAKWLSPNRWMIYGRRHYLEQPDNYITQYPPLNGGLFYISYIELLHQRFKINPKPFKAICQLTTVTLLGYPMGGHLEALPQVILARDFLPNVAKYYGIPYQYHGIHTDCYRSLTNDKLNHKGHIT